MPPASLLNENAWNKCCPPPVPPPPPSSPRDAILALMDAVDSYIPDPVRALDKPFSMPVEDVFSIQVRGWAGGRLDAAQRPAEPPLLPVCSSSPSRRAGPPAPPLLLSPP